MRIHFHPAVQRLLTWIFVKVWVFAFCALPSIFFGGLLMFGYIILGTFVGTSLLDAFPALNLLLPESYEYTSDLNDMTALFLKVSGWYGIVTMLWYAFRRPRRSPFFRAVLLWWSPAPLLTIVAMLLVWSRSVPANETWYAILLFLNAGVFLLTMLSIAAGRLSVLMFEKLLPEKAASSRPF